MRFLDLFNKNRSGSSNTSRLSHPKAQQDSLARGTSFRTAPRFETGQSISKDSNDHCTSTPRLSLRVDETSTLSLLQSLEASSLLLGTKQSESELSEDEVRMGMRVYRELQRVLSRNTRMGDWMSKPSDFAVQNHPFRERYQALLQEFDQAEEQSRKVTTTLPAAVRPLSLDAIQEVNEFFILDNSLRETTVGSARGHTLEEKHKIVRAMARTGLKEVILGAYGSKVSVDSQTAEYWRSLGRSFDSAWGFSDAYDFEPYDEDPLWEAGPDYTQKRPEDTDYYTPRQDPKLKYDKGDLALFRKASSGFFDKAFQGRRLRRVLKESESKAGRVPLGLLMMAGYGIKNAIIDIDTSLETFEYDRYDIVERIKFLIRWCKDNLPKRSNVTEGDGITARVLVNLRDFSNYHRSSGGTEAALGLVDALSRLAPEERPFGFMMEEPTGWLFPSEVGRLCRMVRLTMNRAGFPQGHFLVHVHYYFGLAEASQLAALCNGATGVWAAVCRTGAQVGHACSTTTAVNLYRGGMDSICETYDLAKMCEAAREVTEITTRAPCPSHEEVYGKDAFDIPYMMVNLPSCRYSIFHVLTKIGINDRVVRLNELSLVTHVKRAMEFHFGPPEKTGWDPGYCKKMWDAIHNHLLTGLSRDYNSALGLGHLYGLVSKKKIPWPMVQIMSDHCNISDYNPVVLDFIYRWNRLCALYEGKEVEPHPATHSKSMMFWGVPAVLKPRLEVLPFEFFTADVMRNPVLEPIPRLFKLQVVNLLTSDERKIQGHRIPVINFYETVLRLKLFIQEADSLHVLGLVDDFCIRKNHDYFFGEDKWLYSVNKERPKVANKILLSHMKYYHKHYIQQGDTAISRCIESTACRIDEHRAIPQDMEDVFRRKSAEYIVHEIAETKRSYPDDVNEAHEKMLRELANDEGQDESLASVFFKENEEMFGLSYREIVDGGETLADAYVQHRRDSLIEFDCKTRRRGSVLADVIHEGSFRLKELLQEAAESDVDTGPDNGKDTEDDQLSIESEDEKMSKRGDLL